MVFRCFVPNCRNTTKDAILHLLPKNLELFKLWTVDIQRNDLTISKRRTSRVCDIHFSYEMKFVCNRNRTNLKADAFLTLHLPDSILQSKSWAFAVRSTIHMQYGTSTPNSSTMLFEEDKHQPAESRFVEVQSGSDDLGALPMQSTPERGPLRAVKISPRIPKNRAEMPQIL